MLVRLSPPLARSLAVITRGGGQAKLTNEQQFVLFKQHFAPVFRTMKGDLHKLVLESKETRWRN